MSLSVRERVFLFAEMMMPSTLSNSTSMSEEASGSSVLNPMLSPHHRQTHKIKKKRNLPGNPDPESEVIALSPKSLMATNRFVCEVCKKGFQRDQNLQLHRRGHNLPWKLKQRSSKDVKKKVYVCPEPTCVHNHPTRALGDLTGIKKHFSRKHGEKRWRCDKCQKKYAVQSDYKAHIKTCGTREYKCDCGTIFTRKDSFITHRAFCDALAEESARLSTNPLLITPPSPPPPPPPPEENQQPFHLNPPFFPFSNHFSNQTSHTTSCWDPQPQNSNSMQMIKPELYNSSPLLSSPFFLRNTNVSNNNTTHLSATAMLQTANNTVGTAPISCGATSHSVGYMPSSITQHQQLDLDSFDSITRISPTQYMGFNPTNLSTTWQESSQATRDFLGITGDCGNQAGNVRDLLNFSGAVDFPAGYDRDHSMFKPPGFGFC